jgi:hypothetical protein
MKEVNTKFYIKNPARLVNAFIKWYMTGYP